MSGHHDLKKHQISIKFPHQVWRQVEKAASQENKAPGVYIRDIITLRVAEIPLTSQDARMIADRIEEAEKKGKMQ